MSRISCLAVGVMVNLVLVDFLVVLLTFLIERFWRKMDLLISFKCETTWLA